MKSRGYLLATASGVATAAAAAGGAQAADMGIPAKAAPYMPPALPSWAGWYIGANAGAAWQQVTFGYSAVSSPDKTMHGQTQFIGGGQIGYNWQDGNWVYGLEADISGLAGKASTNGPPGKKGNVAESKIDWLSTFRARAGFVVGSSGTNLIYATGGFAVGQVKNTFAPNGLGSSSNPAFTTKSGSKTQWGWVAGAGFQHMLTPNWIIGLEGLYVDLGTSTYTAAQPVDGKASRFTNRAAILRVRLDYKF
jgi:outer membrane immunogenic protein